MDLPKLEIKKIKIFFTRIPRVLAKNAFLTFLGLFLIVLAGNGILFYKYNISVKKADLKITDQPIEFPKDIHDQILRIWQEREKKLGEIGSRGYLNPFK
ncbi:MAG: hypothetical protein Q7S70_02470 [bacterium]|nr:hypothetical protein [bacterium]